MMSMLTRQESLPRQRHNERCHECLVGCGVQNGTKDGSHVETSRYPPIELQDALVVSEPRERFLRVFDVPNR